MNTDLVKKENKLSQQKLNQYLEDLIKLDLISNQEGKISSNLSEGFTASKKFDSHFRQNYKILIEKLNNQETGKWKSWEYEGFGTFHLSQKSALELRNEMHEIIEKFSKRSEKESKLHNPKDLMDTGTLLINLPMKIKEAFPI